MTDPTGAQPQQLRAHLKMSDAEYRMQMGLLMSAASVILLVDLDGLRRIVAHGEVLGPVMEPSLYAAGGGRRLSEQREFLDAMARVREVCERFRPVGL